MRLPPTTDMLQLATDYRFIFLLLVTIFLKRLNGWTFRPLKMKFSFLIRNGKIMVKGRPVKLILSKNKSYRGWYQFSYTGWTYYIKFFGGRFKVVGVHGRRIFNLVTKRPGSKPSVTVHIKFTGAFANFHQANLKGLQARRVKGYRLSNGNFIFVWKNGGLWKMVLTSNTGRFIKDGYVKNPGKTWKNPKTWTTHKPKFYTIHGFHGIRPGTPLFKHN